MRTLIEFFAIQVFVLVFTYLHVGHVTAGHVLGSVLGGLVYTTGRAAVRFHRRPASCARDSTGTRTDIWRTFSWYLGDKHANRLCWLLDLYLILVGRDPKGLWMPTPRG